MTIHDNVTATLEDLGSQFYLSTDDVGKNRALACKERLQALNPAVTVSAASGEMDSSFLTKFQVVVCTQTLLEDAKRIDQFCHSHEPAIPFIKADVNGLFASVFCDFGPSFTVLDVDGKVCRYCLLSCCIGVNVSLSLLETGEEPHSGIVASVTSGSPALITCVDDERLEFQSGDLVLFSEIEGMTELNDGKPRRIKNCKVDFQSLDNHVLYFYIVCYWFIVPWDGRYAMICTPTNLI